MRELKPRVRLQKESNKRAVKIIEFVKNNPSCKSSCIHNYLASLGDDIIISILSQQLYRLAKSGVLIVKKKAHINATVNIYKIGNEDNIKKKEKPKKIKVVEEEKSMKFNPLWQAASNNFPPVSSFCNLQC